MYDSIRNYTQLSPIYATIDSKKPLSDCNYIFLIDTLFVYCDIKKDEVDDFNDMSTTDYKPLIIDALCGYKLENNIVVFKLDTTKYPVYKIKKVILSPGNITILNHLFTLQLIFYIMLQYSKD